MQSSLKIAPPPSPFESVHTHRTHIHITRVLGVYVRPTRFTLTRGSWFVAGWLVMWAQTTCDPHLGSDRGCAKCVRTRRHKDRVHTKDGQDLATHPGRTEHPRPACVVHTARPADRVVLVHLAAHETEPLTHTSNGATLWWAWAKPFAPHARRRMPCS
jgi:hypothetical protein